MGRVVMVTGVARDLGALLARRLTQDARVAKVIGVDVLPSRETLSGVRFVRLDVRAPRIAEVLADEDIDTVAHLGVSPQLQSVGDSVRGRPNVIATMQLLAACQRSPKVSRLVVASSAAVYGASARSPALLTEDMTAGQVPHGGLARDCVDVEGHVRGFGRRRPDVGVTTLRLGPVLAPSLDTPMSRYLRLPLLPTVLGFDPRLQLLHPDDALAVLHRAVVDPGEPATYNVAGDGVLTLSQLARRTGTPAVAFPAAAFPVLARTLGRLGGVDLAADTVDLLTHGRVLDTTSLRERLRHRLAWSTAATLQAFVAGHGPGPLTALAAWRAHRLPGAADKAGAGRG